MDSTKSKKEIQAEYHRKWYMEHREEMQKYRKEYYETHREQARAYIAKNREKINAAARNRQRIIHDRIKSEGGEAYEQYKAKRRAYYAANKERFHDYYIKSKLKSIRG